jgi:hypothetical protein
MLPEELQSQLAQHGITTTDEVALREALEAHVSTYTLIKLAPWPARRWKCRYRLLVGEKMYDAQSAIEAYAIGLLATLNASPATRRPQANTEPYEY